MVERFVSNEEAMGSIPMSSNFLIFALVWFHFCGFLQVEVAARPGPANSAIHHQTPHLTSLYDHPVFTHLRLIQSQ